jgi:ABC-type transport system involved in multi-copper enzyme maturation permease subunit
MREMASFFPKALIFKEYRQRRMWALLLFLVMGAEPMLSLLGTLLKMWSDPKHYQEHWQVLHYGLWGITSIHEGNASILDYLFVGVAVFGAATLAYERSQGGLWYTLAGPFTRRQVLRVKVTVGWLFVIATITLYTLLFMGFGQIGHADIPFTHYVGWWGYEVLLQGAMFMAAVLAAILVGNLAAASIAGLVLVGAPAVVAAYVEGHRKSRWS